MKIMNPKRKEGANIYAKMLIKKKIFFFFFFLLFALCLVAVVIGDRNRTAEYKKKG